jgi:hypothetical protein
MHAAVFISLVSKRIDNKVVQGNKQTLLRQNL